MWSFLNDSFSRVVGLSGSKGPNFIRRDELCKNSPTNKVKKCDFLESSREPLVCKELQGKKTSVEEKGVIRVKVKMTKQEAARLLSKCKDGGVLEFRDVANELIHIPVNRISVVSSSCGYAGKALTTIPEEV